MGKTVTTTLREGEVIAGRYRLVRTLATGGMGVIWKARHTQLDIDVAIKFMDAACLDDPQARARFEREAKAAAMLNTSHVTRVLDHGVDEGTPYIVMELMLGEDLGEKLRRETRIPVREAAIIVAQAAKGLEAAHAAGIVHRDLKPANIFMAQVDDALVVKLLDFGVAKSAVGRLDKSESTLTGDLLGSPYYMSPEQAVGKDVDRRSDVWSLAAILFRLVTGRHPFPGQSTGDVLVKICTGQLPLPSDVVPELQYLDPFFRKAFTRAPDKRFQSARELANAFAKVANEPLAMGSLSLRRDQALALSPELSSLLASPTHVARDRRYEPEDEGHDDEHEHEHEHERAQAPMARRRPKAKRVPSATAVRGRRGVARDAADDTSTIPAPESLVEAANSCQADPPAVDDGARSSRPTASPRWGAGLVAGLCIVSGTLLTFHVMSPNGPASGAADVATASPSAAIATTATAMATASADESPTNAAALKPEASATDLASASTTATGVPGASATSPQAKSKSRGAAPKSGDSKKKPTGCVFGYEAACKR